MENLPSNMSKIWETLQSSQTSSTPAEDLDHLLPWEAVVPRPVGRIEVNTNTSTSALQNKLTSISNKFNDILQDIESEDHRFNPEEYEDITTLIETLQNLIERLEKTI